MADGGLDPIVRSLGLNEEQCRALAAEAGTVVVTAGAGTGKTRTLVARYLALLSKGLPLRSVVAVTFTRRAAREMRNRVRATIRSYVTGPQVSLEERQRWLGLYRELDAARIGTIHSLCGEILRTHPAQTGLDPRFEVLEEGEARILQREAVRTALSWAAEQQGRLGLFGAYRENRLLAILEALMSAPLDVAEALAAVSPDAMSVWATAIGHWREERYLSLISKQAWREAVEVLSSAAPLDRDDPLVRQRDALLEAVAQQGDVLGQARALSVLEEVNLGSGWASAWQGGVEEKKAVASALSELRSLWREEGRLLLLEPGPADEGLAKLVSDLALVFNAASAAYRQEKDTRQVLDYDDLERLALGLLREDGEVRERWQREVQAILVDECQDTSRRQMDLVELLAGGDAEVFLVGDAKQSIYRFRGADVTVFRRVRQEVEQGGGALVPLALSYRAHAGLVEALNILTEAVLGSEADSAKPWKEPFAPLEAYRQEAGKGFEAPHVELHLALGTKAGGALERAAEALAERLIALVEAQNCFVNEGDVGRPLTYGDVAILCLSSRSFPPYEDALERAGIPFISVASRGFYQRPEVRDLLNALRALADPEDDLALAGLLRSPAVGLSDAALYLLCRARDESSDRSSLWQVSLEGCTPLGDEDARRLSEAIRLVERLHQLAGRWPVGRLLKAFVEETAYQAALLGGGYVRASQNVAKLLSDARESGIVSVGTFLDYVEGVRDAGTREGEGRSIVEGAVQIMTVHAAKGLEFPLVVIGDVGRTPRHSADLLMDPALGILPRPERTEEGLPAVWQWAERREQDQDAAEMLRLFYVAATRACERLLISGSVTVTSSGISGGSAPWLGSLVDVLGLSRLDLSGSEEMNVSEQVVTVGHCPFACHLYGPRWQRSRAVPVAYQPAGELPVEFPPLLEEVGGERVEEAVSALPLEPWPVVPLTEAHGLAMGVVVGRLVHEALQQWCCDPQEFQDWARSQIKVYGTYDQATSERAVERALALLQRFRSSALFQEMTSAEVLLHELPYGRMEGRSYERGVLDALYKKDDMWHIVEFKTDHLRSLADLEPSLGSRYKQQVERYLAAGRQLLGVEPRGCLCLLDCGGQVVLRDMHHIP